MINTALHFQTERALLTPLLYASEELGQSKKLKFVVSVLVSHTVGVLQLVSMVIMKQKRRIYTGMSAIYMWLS